MSARQMKFSEAIREATDLCLEADPRVYLIGLGVPDPMGIFGSTKGLREKYGSRRILDMPTSENAITGMAIGSALAGSRPIMTHQRLDFALTAVEQIVNQAAKWHYMFGGKAKVPMVIRMIVGRGWGQGPQHSQSLHSWFAHIPGLKVVLPATPRDAKGLLIASIDDDNPVIFLEHRWLYNISGPVPEGRYTVPLGRAQILREGTDVTIAALSHMTLEATRAAALLADAGISSEVVDLRTIRPFDPQIVVDSVAKTRRLIVADTSWVGAGFGAEIVASVAECDPAVFRCPPRRLGLPDHPTPTSPRLSDQFYPRAQDIAVAACEMMGRPPLPRWKSPPATRLDVPDPSFTGPF